MSWWLRITFESLIRVGIDISGQNSCSFMKFLLVKLTIQINQLFDTLVFKYGHRFLDGDYIYCKSVAIDKAALSF